MNKFDPGEWVYRITYYHQKGELCGKPIIHHVRENDLMSMLVILYMGKDEYGVIIDSIIRIQWWDYPSQATPTPVQMGMPPLYKGEQ